MSRPTLMLCLVLAPVIGAAACAHPDAVTGKTTSGTLLIRSESDSAAQVDTLIVGYEDWLYVEPTDSNAAASWTVADPSIVRIVEQVSWRVRVRGLRTGTTSLTAEHDGETGTIQLVVRELLASDTIPRVEITTRIDSAIIGDSIPFGFNLVNRRHEYFSDRPFTLRLSDSTVARLLPMASSHSFWIEGLKVGRTVLTVNCECIRDSVTITVHEPPPTVPDPRVSRYEAIDLGTLGGAAAVPLAMNDSGDVVGYSLTADGKQHAFLWSNGAMQDLSPGAARSAAQALTNSRVMAGTSEIGGVVHIVQWDNGQMTDLGPVGSTDRQGEVVGITATDVVAWGDSGSAIWQNGLKQFLSGFRAGAVNSRHQVAGTLLDRPFLWDNGSLIALEYAGTPSHAVDINSTGLVLGDTPEWTQYWGVRPTVVVWSQGRISRMLGSIAPVAINDAGDVIGGVGSGAFYSHDGTPWYIPPLGGGWIEPIDLNDSGIVVGESWTVAKKQRAFVWQTTDGPPIDLGIGPFTDDRLGSSAIAINTRGDIVGWVAPCTTPSGRCTELDQSQARAILWRLKRS